MAVSAMASLLLISIRRNHETIFGLSLLGIAVSFLSLFYVRGIVPRIAGTILVMDQYSEYFMGLILILSAFVCVITYIYSRSLKENREELYVLIVMAAVGGMVLSASGHFVSLFLGFEILSATLYVMISYFRKSESGLEAGIKYLVLAAAASAFLVLGMALIYAETGTLEFAALFDRVKAPGGFSSTFILAGTGLIIVGIGFKIGVVPFHMWTPDIYQGAASPVTAFIASVSKTAMVAFLIRYFILFDRDVYPALFFIIGIISLLSMIAGNLLAVIQPNIKRLLAYSSIAHLGYVLVGLAAIGNRASEAMIFYITVYALSITGAFGLIAFVSKEGDEKDAIRSYRGLFRTRPLTAGVFSILLFSLAGIPLTAGFIGKYFIVLSGLDRALWTLVMVLIITSVIGLYYYLRVIAVMIGGSDRKPEETELPPLSAPRAVVLCIISFLILVLGVYPGPLIGIIRQPIQIPFIY